MTEQELFLVALAVWGLAWGASVFLAERVLTVVAGVAAIATGVLALLAL